ncbi:NADP-dependent oxidoreductase domain-containing protein [Amylocystis lapponica]|nr:NADP-dependent oxidoreductase domain-containing protein [Amylocystis lapponica]
MPASKSVKLNTGAEMPTVGLDCRYLEICPGEVEKAVEIALKNGYRHIDTARAYGNEKEVGVGIKASGVPREEFFLTTKLDVPHHYRAAEALEDSLRDLDTPYLDLWLMHWPTPVRDGKPDLSWSWIDTWKNMEKLYKAHPDKLKAIGVSNVSKKYMEDLLAVAEVVPAVNQIEGHPACMQQELVDFCVSKGITVTSYSPLGSDGAPLIKNQVVLNLAEKYKVSPANILVSLHANRPGVTGEPRSCYWYFDMHLAHGLCVVLPKSTIVDLTDEEVKELADIEKTLHFRACTPYFTGYGSIGFTDLKD